MSQKLRTCSCCWRAATLIEVLAGLAILGSVTVALLLARGNLLEQHATAQRKLEAVRIADQLLAGWYARDSAVPIDEQGEVESHPGWTWRTQIIDRPYPIQDDALPTGTLKVELFNPDSPTPRAAVITVELLAPTPGEPRPPRHPPPPRVAPNPRHC